MNYLGVLTDLKYEYGDGIVLRSDFWNPSGKIWPATEMISGVCDSRKTHFPMQH